MGLQVNITVDTYIYLMHHKLTFSLARFKSRSRPCEGFGLLDETGAGVRLKVQSAWLSLGEKIKLWHSKRATPVSTQLQ